MSADSQSVSAALRALAGGKPDPLPASPVDDPDHVPDMGQGGGRGSVVVDALVDRYGRPEATMGDALRHIARGGRL
jgi:hypothetical protein